jgi:hypothetical protein
MTNRELSLYFLIMSRLDKLKEDIEDYINDPDYLSENNETSD